MARTPQFGMSQHVAITTIALVQLSGADGCWDMRIVTDGQKKMQCCNGDLQEGPVSHWNMSSDKQHKQHSMTGG